MLDNISVIILKKRTRGKLWRDEKEKYTKFLDEKSERKTLFGRPRYMWEDNTK